MILFNSGAGLGTLVEESMGGKRGVLCCYLQETWAVIFGWVELSANYLRQTASILATRAGAKAGDPQYT